MYFIYSSSPFFSFQVSSSLYSIHDGPQFCFTFDLLSISVISMCYSLHPPISLSFKTQLLVSCPSVLYFALWQCINHNSILRIFPFHSCSSIYLWLVNNYRCSASTTPSITHAASPSSVPLVIKPPFLPAEISVPSLRCWFLPPSRYILLSCFVFQTLLHLQITLILLVFYHYELSISFNSTTPFFKLLLHQLNKQKAIFLLIALFRFPNQSWISTF